MRQAITATYFGPTNYKGARIRVKAQAGVLWLGYDYASDFHNGSQRAIEVYADKYGWKKPITFGCLPDGSIVGVFND